MLLSDPKEFSGGQLEYEKDGKIYNVIFPSAGYAFFMKGSSLRHHVTRIDGGKRISLINSYMDKNDPIDHTVLKTFENDHNFINELKYKPI